MYLNKKNIKNFRKLANLPRGNTDSETLEGLRELAEQGVARGQASYAAAWALGRYGLDPDPQKAWFWYKKAADQGHALAQCNTAVSYERGDNVKRNMTEAVRYYTLAANQDDAQSQFNLGVCYENGKGVAVNKAIAAKWYLAAANQGHPKAQCYLGISYQYGDGVAQNNEKAMEWYVRSANQGDACGESCLANCYWKGDLVEQNKTKAVKLMTRAAKGGDVHAQLNLGDKLVNGDGVKQNKAAGAAWTTKAAEAGDSTAQFNLGLLFIKGDGLKKSWPSAMKWFEKAAKGVSGGQSDDGRARDRAQFWLGTGLIRGEDGVESNPSRGLKMLMRASSNGNTEAKALLEGYFLPELYEVPLEVCAVCKTNSVSLQKCAGCKVLKYCSRQHQKEDWRATHKKHCKDIAAKVDGLKEHCKASSYSWLCLC